MKKVKAIYTMGGGVFKGNITPVAEFNYWYDALAVDIMFSLGTDVPIHMIGLDATHSSIFTANDLTFMRIVGGELGKILHDMIQPYLIAYWEYSRYIGCVIHDLLTVIYAIDHTVCPKEGIHHVNLRTSLEGASIGQTVCDIRDTFKLEKNAYVPLEVDDRKFKELFFEIAFSKEVASLYRKYVK